MNHEQKQLLDAAREAAACAYARYSDFRVGAAVLTENGVFKGANIENASANLGICAERVALAHARMHGCRQIKGVAVYCIDVKPGEDKHIAEKTCIPCGGCRQWLAELAPDAWIVTNASDTVYTLPELLPYAFQLSPANKE